MIDLIADDPDDLANKIDGWVVQTTAGEITLHTQRAGVAILYDAESWSAEAVIQAEPPPPLAKANTQATAAVGEAFGRTLDDAGLALLDKARSFAVEGSKALAEHEYQRLIDLYPGSEEAGTAAAELAALSD